MLAKAKGPKSKFDGAIALSSFKSALDIALKVVVIVGFLAATRLIGSLPELHLAVETFRLINVEALPADAEGAVAAARGYNARVEAKEGIQMVSGQESVLFWLPPITPSEDAIVSNLMPVIFWDQESERWTLLVDEEEPKQLPGAFEDWESEEVGGCNELIAEINARYGPVGCQPQGGIIGLSGSSGIPVYAVLLLNPEIEADDAADLRPDSSEELGSALDAIETAFYLSATISVLNDGGVDAKGVEVAIPEFKPEGSNLLADIVPGLGFLGEVNLSEGLPIDTTSILPPFVFGTEGDCFLFEGQTRFDVGTKASCAIQAHTDVVTRADLPLAAPQFQVGAENDNSLRDIENWGLIGIGAIVVLFFGVWAWAYVTARPKEPLETGATRWR